MYYPFLWGTQGRFQLVDIYPKFKGHCMEMKVQIKTTVNHGEFTDHHDSPEVNMGCDNTWFVKGDDGNKIPVNADGQNCISDQIWEWDTPEPGTTPLKWKLNCPEQPNSDICN